MPSPTLDWSVRQSAKGNSLSSSPAGWPTFIHPSECNERGERVFRSVDRETEVLGRHLPTKIFITDDSTTEEVWNILILLLGIALSVAATRKRPSGRRRRFTLRKVRIASSPDVGALAAGDVTAVAITNATADKLRFITLDASYTWADIQQITDDGMTFGLAHSDYSAAEIEECLESFTAIDLGDKVAQERSNRLVREIGTFSSVTSAAGSGAQFNDGKPVKTKLNWLMSAGDQLNIWFRNGSGIVYVDGSSVTVNGTLWVKD